MNSKKLVLLNVAILMLGCGRKDDERTSAGIIGADSFVEDATLAQGAVEANVSDSMASLADANEDSSDAALWLADTHKDKIRDRKCEKVDDHHVNVTVGIDVDRSIDLSNARRELTRTVKGSADLIRSWSADNIPLDCTEQNHVKLDWKGDITGLSLDVQVNRTHEMSQSLTIKRTNKTITNERSFSAKGNRHISWLSSTEDATADTLTREKTISSSMTRTMHMQNVKGDVKDIEFNVATDEKAPLAITVVRKKSDGSLISKTIKSGIVIATRVGDGKVSSTFKNIVMKFDASTCALDSGTITTHFYKDGSDTAAKRYQLEGSDGVFVLTDLDSGAEIEDFEIPGCSLSDYSL